MIRDSLDKMTPEEREALFPKPLPVGWISIEEALPMFKAIDIMNGGSAYIVRDKDGREFQTQIADHNVWYYIAKEQGITHWWNGGENSVMETKII
jgi:hypothetical protein